MNWKEALTLFDIIVNDLETIITIWSSYDQGSPFEKTEIFFGLKSLWGLGTPQPSPGKEDDSWVGKKVTNIVHNSPFFFLSRTCWRKGKNGSCEPATRLLIFHFSTGFDPTTSSDAQCRTAPTTSEKRTWIEKSSFLIPKGLTILSLFPLQCDTARLRVRESNRE